MKISVLLPTRNRLDLLKNAVYTVMHQAYDDWEIIISDNDSEEDVKGYIDSLSDSRIRYFRTAEFVSVTRNWNNALAQASGDYVIMLGDDDCLVQGFFQIVNELATRFEQPDLIYTDAYLYAYPGVVPGYPKGFLQLGYNSYFKTRREPFLLERSTALDIVQKSLAMGNPVSFNMQVSVVRCEFIRSLAGKGEFFQSPFPDYYATVVSFLKAEHILIYQQPIVMIGISPKSYGYYYFNRSEGEGVSFLNNLPERTASKLQDVLLPGSWETTCRLMAMEAVVSNYSEEASQVGLSVNVRQYRRLQAHYNIQALLDRAISIQQFIAMTRRLNWQERWRDVIVQMIQEILSRLSLRVRRVLGQPVRTKLRRIAEFMTGRKETPIRTPTRISDFPTILAAFEQMPAHHEGIS